MTHPQDVEPAGLKLAPCPFCGGEAVFSENMIDFEPVWGVRCDDKCFAWIDACTDTKAEAAEVWNTRASPSPSGDVREAVARIVAEAVAETIVDGWPLFMESGYESVGAFADHKWQEQASKADQIAALYVERIGVGVSQSQPCTDGALPILKETQHSGGEG